MERCVESPKQRKKGLIKNKNNKSDPFKRVRKSKSLKEESRGSYRHN